MRYNNAQHIPCRMIRIDMCQHAFLFPSGRPISAVQLGGEGIGHFGMSQTEWYSMSGRIYGIEVGPEPKCTLGRRGIEEGLGSREADAWAIEVK